MGGSRPGSRRVGRGLALGAAGVALVPLLSGCLREVGDAFGGFGWPQGGITDRSEQMYDLWVGSMIAALLVGLLVWGLIFWCVVRYRKRDGDQELPPQTRFNLPMEVLYTVAPFLVIAVLFYYTVVVQDEVEHRSANPDVTVEVEAFKWNWRFNYVDHPGPDGAPVAVTGTTDEVPVLVLPVGQTVRFVLTAEDVIHSFWVPALLFKRDVFPGNVRNEFEVTIQVEQVGSYVGRCAELCGTYHSMMNFELRAVTPEQFNEYIQLRQDGQSAAEALAAVTGEPYATTTVPFDTRRVR